MTMVWPETGWRNLVLPRHERTLENIGKVKVEEIIQTCSEAQRSIKITPGTKIQSHSAMSCHCIDVLVRFREILELEYA